MVIKVFAIHDSKSECFRFPFFMQNAGVAIRMFTESVNDGKSEISRHPGDFTLFEIGTFDDDKGIVAPHKSVINLGVALSFKKESLSVGGK